MIKSNFSKVGLESFLSFFFFFFLNLINADINVADI